MSGGKILKKRDFYSGGPGIDYFNDDSMEDQSESGFPTDEDNRCTNSSYDCSLPSPMQRPDTPQYMQTECSPLPISPTPQYPQYHPDHSSSHINSYDIQNNLPLYMSQARNTQPNSTTAHISSIYPQMGPISGILHVHQMHPELPYGTCPPPNPYSPLRPMNTNGVHGVVGMYDTSQPTCIPEGVAGMSNLSESQRKKRKQECSLCLNHNQHVEVKGHKWFCPYRKCDCERCGITKGRQHHMKEQQKLTRALHRNTNPL